MELDAPLRVVPVAFNARLRWGVFAALAVLGVVLYVALRIDASLIVILVGISAAAWTSSAWASARSWQAGAKPSAHSLGRLRALFFACLALDLALGLVAVQLTGGIASPVLLMLLAYLFIIDLHSTPLVGTATSVGTLFALAGLTFLELYRLYQAKPGEIPTDLYDDAVFSLLILAVLAAALYLGLSQSRRIAAQLRSHQARLAQSTAALTRRIAELGAQREIDNQLAASLQLDIVLDTIAASALRLVGATDVHLFLFDEASDRFGTGVGVWENGERRLAVDAPRENGLCRAVVRAAHPVLIDSVEQHPLFSNPEAVAWNMKSIAGFPVIKAGRVLGVLSAAFLTSHHFTDDERDALLGLADQAALAIDNASLYSQVERRARELGALYQVSLGISRSWDPAQLMQDALDAVLQVVKAPRGSISLVDESSGELVLEAQSGHTPSALEEMRARRLKAGEGFAGHVLLTGQPLVVADASRDSANAWRYTQAEGILALAALPLKRQDRVIGVLEVARQDAESFAPADVNLLGAIAQQLAIALENARLYAEIKRRADELASLREIGLATTSTLDLREQQRLLHTQVQRLIHPDSFFIALFDETRQEIDVEFVVEEGWEMRGPTISLNAPGLSPWVIRTRRPLRVNDLAAEGAQLPVAPQHVTRPARSWLGVPLVVGHRAIGLISVQSFRPCAFTAADERFLIAIAQHAALAIENARLYQKTERRARELSLLNDISRAITASLELPDIYRRTVNGLANTLGYELISIYLVQQDELRLQAQAGYGQAPQARSIKAGVFGRVMRTGEPAFVQDIHADPEFEPALPGVRAEISVPIRQDKRIVGVLDVQDQRAGALSEEDVRILSAFSEHIGVALANARLYQAVVERERLATFHHRVALALSCTPDVPRILQILCRESADFFAVHGAYVWVVQGTCLAGAAAFGAQAPGFLDGRLELSDGDSFVAQVARERRAAYLNDLPNSGVRNAALEGIPSPLSIAAAPVLIENELDCILVLVDQRSAQRFGPSDLEHLALFTRQAAIALGNARAYLQARHSAAGD